MQYDQQYQLLLWPEVCKTKLKLIQKIFMHHCNSVSNFNVLKVITANSRINTSQRIQYHRHCRRHHHLP